VSVGSGQIDNAADLTVRGAIVLLHKLAFLYHFFAVIDMFPARQRGDWGAGRAATYNR